MFATEPIPDAVPRALHFRRRQRLSRALEFQDIYDARVRKHRGPLTVFARPNDLNHARLGLSVGKRVGGAVKRNAVKRRLREAFRHLQYEVARPYDLVINVAPHQLLPAQDYQSLLLKAWVALDEEWLKRQRRTAPQAQ